MDNQAPRSKQQRQKPQDDFLWFSYFGITKDEASQDRDLRISRCIKRAYLDLSRTVRYSISTTDLERMKSSKSEDDRDQALSFDRRKQGFLDEVKKDLSTKIYDLLVANPANPAEYFEGTDSEGSKSWHKAACDAIRNKAIRDKANSLEGNLPLLKPDHQFTYGQAQKWVNMSLKYLYVMGFDDMSHIERVIHVPVDSLIIDAANELGVRWPSASWSKLDNYSEYLAFQKKLRQKIPDRTECPLVWENHAWIELARIHAEKAAR